MLHFCKNVALLLNPGRQLSDSPVLFRPRAVETLQIASENYMIREFAKWGEIAKYRFESKYGVQSQESDMIATVTNKDVQFSRKMDLLQGLSIEPAIGEEHERAFLSWCFACKGLPSDVVKIIVDFYFSMQDYDFLRLTLSEKRRFRGRVI